YGTTPNTIHRLLVGNYSVTLTKQGYASESRQVTISEGRTAELNVTLSSGKEIAFSSDPAGAELYIDGQYKGATPITINVPFGQHSVKVQKGTDKAEDNITVSTTSSQNSYRYEIGNAQTITVNGVSFKMIKVQGGTFTMGGTSEQGSDAYDWEKPTHSVTLRTYYIGETEVTQALWKAVMGNNPSNWKGDNLPVESVSWNDVQTFITKLNQLTGKQFRLPTEAEWEYAARGGNKSKGYKYSGSNDVGSVAWYDGNSGNKTHAVKTKSPNELGLYDMSGNVWEWCQDWYGNYNSSSQTNPTGPSSGSNRVVRGGDWGIIARGCRVSNRNCHNPTFRNCFIGFRLALL
ncbi:MAG: SUMF1/EgtB/PvdO family nonheme iron enzyme, partial [Bacteroidales bacterium]|nr:SUMF1/EgtB/PvdO family nonheme iron enzyme [Bacteroidales bacterium]